MWKNGMQELDTGRFKPSLGLLLDNAMERSVRDKLRFLGEADILLSLITVDTVSREFLELAEEDRLELTRTRSLLENFLAEGVRVRDCRVAFEACLEPGFSQPNPFLREFFREPVGNWLDDMPDGAGVSDLVEKIFENAEKMPESVVLTGLFRYQELYQAIRASKVKVEIFDKDGALVMESLKDRAQYLTGEALAIAARCGEKAAEPAHLLAAMLLCKESYTHLILRKMGVATTGTKISTYLQNTFPQDDRLAPELPPVRSSFGDGADQVLESAVQAALEMGETRGGEREILAAVVRCDQPKIQYLFETVLHMKTEEILSVIGSVREPDVIEPVLPLEICECKNLSSQKRPVIIRGDVVEAVVRVFSAKKAAMSCCTGSPA